MIAITSDKHTWHRFTPVYEAALAKLGPVDRVVEFGVLNGDSMRWLRACYPEATLHGVDILPVSPHWPQDDRIAYHRLDQGDPAAVRAFFAGLDGSVDLLIEDGSHQPVHQLTCLKAGLPHLRRGGLYILEDIHTSHPAHGLSREGAARGQPNALHLLLAARHLREVGHGSAHRRASWPASELFTPHEAEAVLQAMHVVEFFRRASLPLTCWRCASTDFDYAHLRCRCGVDLYAEADSMTALITKA